MSNSTAVSWQQSVCTLTLSQAATGNALSAVLVAEVDAHLDRCAVEPPGLLVLRGEGRHFCTGFDLSDLERESDDSLLARFCRIELMLQKLHRATYPTLAIAHGRTVGAGADLFAACRHRLATTGTQFAFPGAAGFGLVLGTRRLMHRVGVDCSREWLTTASTISADRALASGLATGLLTQPLSNEDLVRATNSAPHGNHQLSMVLEAQEQVHDHLDLAHLVRSAAVPGLRARIAAYLERSKQVPRR